jgi:nucleoside-diphosphate-sugar epimerase
MARHVIVGSGPVGSATALRLAEAGHEVRVITRRGGGPAHPGVERVAADATDAVQLAELTTGAVTLYNCANPAYHRWPQLWPPLAAAILTAAERTGAGLVTMGNLYGYGPVDTPMTEDLPLAARTVKGRVRARMWQDALAAHEAGRVRATEARASDYLGPGAVSALTVMVLPKVRAGKAAMAPANFDVPHSLTATVDAARTLVALGTSTDDRTWGRPWHVPTNPATTVRQVVERYARLAGAPRPRLRTMPTALLRVGGLFDPAAREVIEMRYQFDRPFVLDSSAARHALGIEPTPMDEILRSML